MRLDLDRIRVAHGQIDPQFTRTLQYECTALSEALGCRLVIKVETLNPVRSFKGRGVETVLNRLGGRPEVSGVVCASAGNLGQALAYCGARRGLAVTVAAAVTANRLKIDRMRAFGAEVILVDGGIEEALVEAARVASSSGAYLLQDSQDVGTGEGAATIGLELAESVDLDAVVVALGAGAMASGVGFAIKRLQPATEMITVQPAQAPAMTLALRAGRPVEVGPPETIADGVAGRYVLPDVLADLLEVTDDAMLVSEEHIVGALGLIYRQAGLVVEPAGALGVAAILADRDRFAGRTVAAILCGSNVAPNDFLRWTSAP